MFRPALLPIFLLLLLQVLSSTLPAQQASPESDRTGTKTMALFDAIRTGSAPALQKELNAGANPNDSLLGYSALMAATLNGSAAQMKMLIEHGACVNCTTKDSISALWLAIPDWDKTRLLLDHGADLGQKVQGFGILAKLASLPGAEPLFRLLIDKGADPRNSAPRNYLLYASAASGDTALLGLLIRMGFSVNDTTDFGDYPINSALQFRTFPTLKMLVDNGADVNARSMYLQTFPELLGFTPLMTAALNKDKPSFLYLLDHGADPKLSSKKGFTALMLLQQSEADDPEMTLALLNHGADPMVKTPDGSDALYYALKKGNTRSAALLQQFSTH